MFPARSPISLVALVSAAGLLVTAMVAWLLPVPLASSGFVLIGQDTLTELVPVLRDHRLLLLVAALVGAALGGVSLWGVPPYPGAGFLLGAGVATESGVLLAVVPVALVVLGLLALNVIAWALLVRVGLAALRLAAS